MNDTKKGSRSNHPTDPAPGTWRNRSLKEAAPGLFSASEESFRYPGPRPRTREAAIIMLADAAEAASRSLRNPSPEEIEQMVTRIVNRAYLDGQLNECDVTLRDLHAVGKAFRRVLSAVSHTRVEYPKTPASGRP